MLGDKDNDATCIVLAEAGKNPEFTQNPPEVFFHVRPIAVGLLYAEDIAAHQLLVDKAHAVEKLLVVACAE